ncbi:MAG: SDR family oxidoreductase [Acidobacteria bacterium]|nr:SDR family oxidoreductase [Acidobacteriota bacterium]
MARIVVTGGSGFVGSHVCARLVERGDDVTCVDNLSSGRLSNVASLARNDRFDFVRADIVIDIPVDGDVDGVFHLASPASPPDYLAHPLETLAVGSTGTQNTLELAQRCGARLLLASTSEVYGDPQVHPQDETYWGNVNPVGPRSVYDEAKRFAEALVMAHHRAVGTDVTIARIFNSYGPNMSPADGRVVSNFITQALGGEPLTIYGDGSQTRSFCFIDDLVDGLIALYDSNETGPINIGAQNESTVAELAERIIALTGSSSEIVAQPLPADDPKVRCPDLERASRLLGWAPKVDIDDGLRRTIEYFRRDLNL